MSLKAVHLVFVTALAALAVFLGVWSLRDYRAPQGTVGDLVSGGVAFAVAVAVLAYGRYVLKKLKNESFL